MKRRPDILNATSDSNLFAAWFHDRATWAAWFAFLAALFALPMAPDQLSTYQRCTGRLKPPTGPAREAWLVCGRRAGKSFILALIAVYLATFFNWRPHLAPGERATIMVIAADRRQARIVLRYIKAFLALVPMLNRLVERETAEGFDLENSVTIEIHTASFRSTRGYTLAAVIADEIAFWPTDDAAEPDYEVLNALRPGMATIPGAMLLCASSPYARRGALWDAHRRHYSKEGDPILVWQASTREMNPTVPASVIDEASDRDAASAAAEYGAQFRTDIESFIAREAVEACVAAGVRERAPLFDLEYAAFVDPSGGSSDSMTLAIGHREDDITVLDALRERKPPFSPDDVVAEFAGLLKGYRISKVVGDRYGGEWVREPFGKHNIDYELADKPKSELYRDLLPAINSRKLALLDHDRLINQIVGLERRTARSGKDSIDHGPGAHDDLANVVAGVAAALAAPVGYDSSMNWVGDLSDADEWRALQLRHYLMMNGGFR